MPHATTDDGVRLYYEETGSGFPLVWCHEFAGSFESWEAQVRFFSRRYRVITYNARGYPPSDVPGDAASYSQQRNVDDLYQLLRHLEIQEAFIGGLSMGGATTLHFGLQHPQMARALVIASAGSGSDDPPAFREGCQRLADALRANGTGALEAYAAGPARVQLHRKDPRGYEDFRRLLMAHSAEGSAFTMENVQGKRAPMYDFGEAMERLEVPTLVIIGDEDTACVQPAIFMKEHIPSAGLAVLPQAGHGINLEDPDVFNRHVLDFLTAVEAGAWVVREPL